MRCKKARKLISLCVAPDESWLGPEDRRALETHLAVCASCRRDHDESRAAISMLRECWRISDDTRALLDEDRGHSRRDVRTGVIALRGARRHAAACAAAACLILAMLGGWTLLNREDSPPGADNPSAVAAEGPLAIELSDGSRIAPGARIETSRRETQSFVLNGRHQVVMNADTLLSVEPLTQEGRTGCLVRLARGEMYVHVDHDGNPFLVQTAHGRAVITGTIFDVRATDTGTTLVVAEGSVRFEAGGGDVQVPAGQQSTITEGLLQPGAPVACDVVALTAWAGRGETVAQGASAGETFPDNLPSMLSSSAWTQIDLEGINSARWAEQNREWFRRHFPWVFEVRQALSQEGIDADYPELLMRSGAIWPFVYAAERPEQFSCLDPDSLLALIRDFGRDRQWLLQHVPAAKIVLEQQEPPAANISGMQGLEEWLGDSRRTAELRLPDSLRSYHAAQYIARTRTLAWLAVRDGRYGIAPGQREQVLELLRKIVLTAEEWQYGELCLQDAAAPPGCDSSQSNRARAQAALANTLYGCEKTLAQLLRTGAASPGRQGPEGSP